MSDEDTKEKRSKRIQKVQNFIKKQMKIAKLYGLSVDEPHRLAKKHALNCGNPDCVMCANPRKLWKETTMQEKSFYQKKLQDTDYDYTYDNDQSYIY